VHEVQSIEQGSEVQRIRSCSPVITDRVRINYVQQAAGGTDGQTDSLLCWWNHSPCFAGHNQDTSACLWSLGRFMCGDPTRAPAINCDSSNSRVPKDWPISVKRVALETVHRATLWGRKKIIFTKVIKKVRATLGYFRCVFGNTAEAWSCCSSRSDGYMLRVWFTCAEWARIKDDVPIQVCTKDKQHAIGSFLMSEGIKGAEIN
jgi:hypothetical protein